MSFNTQDYELVPKELIDALRKAFIRRDAGTHGAVPVLTAARAVVDSVPQQHDQPDANPANNAVSSET